MRSKPAPTVTLSAAPQPEATCTCPSGDGSLRHPCPAHPPEAAQTAGECDECGAPKNERCRNRIGNDGEGDIYYMCSRHLEKHDPAPAAVTQAPADAEALEDWLGKPDAWYEAGPCYIGFIHTDKAAVQNYINKRNAEMGPRSGGLTRQGPYPLYGHDRCYDLVVALLSARRERDDIARRLSGAQQAALAAAIIALADEREAGYRAREHGDVVNGRITDKLVALANTIKAEQAGGGKGGA